MGDRHPPAFHPEGRHMARLRLGLGQEHLRNLRRQRLHRAACSYSPYGAAQIQWSSEYADEELGLTYYNYNGIAINSDGVF